MPYDEGFPPIVTVIHEIEGKYGRRSTDAISWKNNQEKHRLMSLLSRTARQFQTPAIILSSDTFWLNAERFAEHFHLPPPSKPSFETFRDQYHAILKRDYDGYLGNLPRELCTEAVITAIKGPGVEGCGFFSTAYTGRGKDIRFESTELQGGDCGYSDLAMLPDWWDRPIQ